MAQAVGIPAFTLIACTFGIGTALAGIAGAILANQFFVSPTGGVSLSVYAYIAVVIGGWGSIAGAVLGAMIIALRSEEHTSELQSLMRTSYAVFCLKKKK